MNCLIRPQIRFRKEQEFLASEKLRDKQLRKEAYRKEQERIQKSENARAETEAILERQQREVEARKREMILRDQEREAVKNERQRIMVRLWTTMCGVSPVKSSPSGSQGAGTDAGVHGHSALCHAVLRTVWSEVTSPSRIPGAAALIPRVAMPLASALGGAWKYTASRTWSLPR